MMRHHAPLRTGMKELKVVRDILSHAAQHED
jgi:hypothetical protein